MEVLQRSTAQADRSGQPLCVALLDVDHFKRINDEHGHDSGDRVLRTLGGLLARHTRAADCVGRYGGEEFLLVMPNTSLVQAREMLDRLRGEIASTDWPGVFEGATGVTVTIGVATCAAGASAESTIRRADAALYAGKAAGRNRVVLAQA